MTPLLDPINPDLLYVIVFGPGRGETVLIHVPRGRWIVIDSFRAGAFPASSRAIAKYGGEVDLLIATHPHFDHCGGFVDLIDRFPDARIGCVHPAEEDVLPNVPNDPLAMAGIEARKTYDRIWDEWEKNNAKKWLTIRDSSWSFDNGFIRTLHPPAPTSRSDWSKARVNELSSAMWLEWHQTRVLLGADVTKSSWPDIASSYPFINRHDAMKIPHHGSNEAIDDSFGDGRDDRFWLLTPYARKVPDFASGKGMDVALAMCVDEIHATALPFRHSAETQVSLRTTRGDIHRGTLPSKLKKPFPPLDAMQRGIAVAFDEVGQIVETRYGQGTVRIQK